MTTPRYDAIASDDRLYFEFFSVGPKGQIHKIVEYTYLDHLGW